MSKIRPGLIGVSAAGTGLVAGLALGVTGLANAASTSTLPSKPGSASVAGEGHDGHPRGDRDRRGAPDLVTAVSGRTLTLDTPSAVKTVTGTAATLYTHGQGTASPADVKANEIVRVRFVDPTAAAPVAKSVRIELARADGYVTVVNGTSFTVIGRDGFARTVKESTTTVYRNAGAAGSPSEVTVGKLVCAQGNLDGNRTTLDATRIDTGMPPRMKPGAGTGPGSGTSSATGGSRGTPASERRWPSQATAVRLPAVRLPAAPEDNGRGGPAVADTGGTIVSVAPPVLPLAACRPPARGGRPGWFFRRSPGTRLWLDRAIRGGPVTQRFAQHLGAGTVLGNSGHC